ncbi:MAG: PQQ-dependent sugar dehydrogenase, partial [Gammaproteobacteria bacterium]
MRNNLIGIALVMLNACGGGDASAQSDSCSLAKASANPVSVKLQQVFTGLTFAYPIGLMQAPGDDSRWFLLEREGIVKVFANDPLVSTSSTFIDIHSLVDQSGEGGLLGMAFHPDFAKNGQVFLSYTRTSSPLTSYISRFTSQDKGLTLAPISEQPIL